MRLIEIWKSLGREQRYGCQIKKKVKKINPLERSQTFPPKEQREEAEETHRVGICAPNLI